MKIYKHEKAIANKIQQNKITVASSITPVKSISEELYETLAKANKVNKDQMDLDYKYGILTSIGWNGNDDVFDKNHTWAARKTPIDKQLNYMHDNTFIIGHMTDSFGLDYDAKIILDDSTAEALPNEYDIGIAFVIYNRPDQNTPRDKAIAKIVREINEGKLYLSMEVLFDDFDYAIIDKDGTQKVVARTDDTSFLSNYLRSYGGKGVYDDRKVGRLLKNMTFSGIGIVDEPANDRSVIFTKGSVKTFISSGNLIIKDIKMNEEEVTKLQNELAEAKAKADKLTQVEEALATLQAKFTEVEAKVATLESEKTALTEQLTTANTKAQEAEDKLAKAAAEQAKAARIAKLVAAGQTEEEAAKIFDKWSDLSDEKFADIVTLHAKAEKKPEEKKKENSANFAEASVDKDIVPAVTKDDDATEASGRKEMLAAWASKAFKLTKETK